MKSAETRSSSLGHKVLAQIVAMTGDGPLQIDFALDRDTVNRQKRSVYQFGIVDVAVLAKPVPRHRNGPRRRLTRNRLRRNRCGAGSQYQECPKGSGIADAGSHPRGSRGGYLSDVERASRNVSCNFLVR